MKEENFKLLIEAQCIESPIYYALMKEFFKECLYSILGEGEIHKHMRNLFINIVYNGFEKTSYYKWTAEITEDTQNKITTGIKEKKLRNELKELLKSTTKAEKISSNPQKDTGSEVNKLIESLKNKWLINEKKSHEYYDEIKNKSEYNCVIIGEDAPYGGAYLFGDKDKDKNGPYYNSLVRCFNPKGSLSESLKDNKVLFFDLLTIPLVISSNLRKEWSTGKIFKIDGKQFPVFLLEVAFEHFQLKDKIPNAKFAVMMPTKTSASIYNYFESLKDEKNVLFLLKERLTAKSCWKEIKNGYINVIEEGKCFNYYKSNTISGSNTPDADLLKYALDIKT